MGEIYTCFSEFKKQSPKDWFTDKVGLVKLEYGNKKYEIYFTRKRANKYSIIRCSICVIESLPIGSSSVRAMSQHSFHDTAVIGTIPAGEITRRRASCALYPIDISAKRYNDNWIVQYFLLIVQFDTTHLLLVYILSS